MTNEEIAGKLGSIEATLMIIKDRLLGNGQPGEIDKMNRRLVSLERDANFSKGALWILGAVLTLAISGGLIHVFKLR